MNELSQIFADKILSSVTEVSTPWLSGFLPMVGHKYTGELMIVGRAIYREWSSCVTPRALRKPRRRTKFANDILASVIHSRLANESGCPMTWVTCGNHVNKKHVYNTRTSQFWNYTRSLVARLGIADLDKEDCVWDDCNSTTWPSRLVWSNLYKLSPTGEGNPNSELRNAQFDGCLELLRWEFNTYKPRRILFLTGFDRAEPFLEDLWIKPFKRLGSHKLAQVRGRIQCGDGFAQCVVAKHPQGKGKRKIPWVNQVAAAFH